MEDSYPLASTGKEASTIVDTSKDNHTYWKIRNFGLEEVFISSKV